MGTTTRTKSGPQYDGMRVSREQYLELDDDGCKYDMVDGVLRMTPSGDFFHGSIQARMASRMTIQAEQTGAGRVAVEVDVLLPDGEDVLRPDISFLLNENMEKVFKHIHGAPDIAVEILSPSTRDRDLGIKAERYLKNGVREYWILDPQDKSIQVWINRNNTWEKRTGEFLESKLLEGFAVSAKEVFGE